MIQIVARCTTFTLTLLCIMLTLKSVRAQRNGYDIDEVNVGDQELTNVVELPLMVRTVSEKTELCGRCKNSTECVRPNKCVNFHCVENEMQLGSCRSFHRGQTGVCGNCRGTLDCLDKLKCHKGVCVKNWMQVFRCKIDFLKNTHDTNRTKITFPIEWVNGTICASCNMSSQCSKGLSCNNRKCVKNKAERAICLRKDEIKSYKLCTVCTRCNNTTRCKSIVMCAKSEQLLKNRCAELKNITISLSPKSSSPSPSPHSSHLGVLRSSSADITDDTENDVQQWEIDALHSDAQWHMNNEGQIAKGYR